MTGWSGATMVVVKTPVSWDLKRPPTSLMNASEPPKQAEAQWMGKNAPPSSTKPSSAFSWAGSMGPTCFQFP